MVPRACHHCGRPIPAFHPGRLCGECFVMGLRKKRAEPAVLRPKRFGDFEVLERIGEGGMGEVFLARQISLDRKVALKVTKLGLLTSLEHRARFLKEAEIVASLNHPHVVKVFERGECDGQMFFAMELVEESLADLLRRGSTPPPAGEGRRGQVTPERASPRWFIECLVKVCDAVRHANGLRILHRDLKPGNILIDRGEPKITDFGLAKHLDHGGDLTRSAVALGTPAYMAPEQVTGGSEDLTLAVDVYGLGAVLYEILTGRAPYAGKSALEILGKVRDGGLQRPRSIDPAIDRDLETVCLKCLEREPSRRYSDASALAADLRRWLRREPVEARPVPVPERLWYWCRRKPWIAGLSAAVGTSLVLGLATTLWQGSRAIRMGRLARANLYAADVRLAQAAWSEGDLGRARRLLESQTPGPGEPDLRGLEWRLLDELCRTEHRKELWHATNSWLAFAVDPTHHRLAAAGYGEVVLVDLPNSTILRKWKLHSVPMLRDVAISPSGRHVAVGDFGGIRLLEAESGIVRELSSSMANRLAFSPDGSRLAACMASPQANPPPTDVLVFDLARNGRPTVLRHAAGPALGWSDETTLDVIENQGAVRRWSLPDGSSQSLPGTSNRRVVSAVIDRHGSRIATSGLDGVVEVRDARRGDLSWRLDGQAPRGLLLSFLSGGSVLAIAGNSHRIEFRDAGTGGLRSARQGHEAEVTALLPGPDGELWSGSLDGTIRAWHPEDSARTSVREFEHSLRDTLVPPPCFSTDGRWLGLCLEHGPASGRSVLVETSSGTVQAELPGQPMGFSATGRSIWCRSWSGVWIETSLEGTVLSTNAPQSLGTVGSEDLLSGNGEWWLRKGPDGDLAVVHTKTGKVVSRRGEPTVSHASSGDASLVVLRGEASGVGLWSPFSDSFELLDRAIVSDAFAIRPDNRQCALGGWDNVLYVADRETGRWTVRHRLRGHRAGVSAVAFSPDGRTLISGSEDNQLRFWHTTSWRELMSLGLSGRVAWLAVSPDGTALVAGTLAASGDGSAGRFHLWKTTPAY